MSIPLNDLDIGSLKDYAEENKIDISSLVDEYHKRLVGAIYKKYLNENVENVEENAIDCMGIDVTQSEYRKKIVDKIQRDLYSKGIVNSKGQFRPKAPSKAPNVTREEVKKAFLNRSVNIPGLVDMINSYVPTKEQLHKNLLEVSNDIRWNMSKSKIKTKGIIVPFNQRLPGDLCLEHDYNSNIGRQNRTAGNRTRLIPYSEEELNLPVLYGTGQMEFYGKVRIIGYKNELMTFGELLDQLYTFFLDIPEDDRKYLEYLYAISEYPDSHRSSYLPKSNKETLYYVRWQDQIDCEESDRDEGLIPDSEEEREEDEREEEDEDEVEDEEEEREAEE